MATYSYVVAEGRRVGRLTVVAEGKPYFWRGRFSRRRWLCDCACGGQVEVREDLLRSGHTVSCGCARDDAGRARLLRHGARCGGARSPEYRVWLAMLRQNGEAQVTDSWRETDGNGFLAFLRDMGPRPGPTSVLVRRDPRKPFAATNCAWAGSRPRHSVPRRMLNIGGDDLSLHQAAQLHGVGYAALCKRLSRGWPVWRALGLDAA